MSSLQLRDHFISYFSRVTIQSEIEGFCLNQNWDNLAASESIAGIRIICLMTIFATATNAFSFSSKWSPWKHVYT